MHRSDSILDPHLVVPGNIKFCKAKMFADDVKLYSKAKDNHADISKVCDWSKKWQIPLNSQKCKELRLGISKDSAEAYIIVNRTIDYAYILSSHDNKETSISRV